MSSILLTALPSIIKEVSAFFGKSSVTDKEIADIEAKVKTKVLDVEQAKSQNETDIMLRQLDLAMKQVDNNIEESKNGKAGFRNVLCWGMTIIFIVNLSIISIFAICGVFNIIPMTMVESVKTVLLDWNIWANLFMLMGVYIDRGVSKIRTRQQNIDLVKSVFFQELRKDKKLTQAEVNKLDGALNSALDN